jgi:hypothetical protein
MNNIKIEYVNTSLLNPALYNPRKWSTEQIKKLTESISKFGIIDPIIVNNHPERENIVIGGHFRLSICKDLGYLEVPVVYVSLSLDKEKELNIRLNKNQGEFDYDLLKNFDLSLLEDIGFTGDDLSNIWDNEVELLGEEFNEEKELQKIKKPKTKSGDLILLGNHRLICGSSNDHSVLERLFGTEKTSMIYSDPIYNINIDYSKGVGGKQNYGGDVEDSRTEEEYISFLTQNIKTALSFATKDCHVFYWNTEQQIWMVQSIYRTLGIQNKRVCLWIKNGHNPTPQVAFNKCYEPCIYGTIGSPYLSKKQQALTEVLNSEVGTGNQSLDNINIWTEKRLNKNEYAHATSKPPELHHKAILRCTKPNDIVFDSFGGSGSTLIACEQLNRRSYSVELEPIYCDLIINRYKKMTNGEVIVTPYEKATN